MPQALVQLSLARPFPPAHQLPLWCPRGRGGCSIPQNKQHRPHTYSNVHTQTSGDALYPLSTWTGGLWKHRAWRRISPLISQMGKLRPRQGALCPQAQWSEPGGRPPVSESQPVAPSKRRRPLGVQGGPWTRLWVTHLSRRAGEGVSRSEARRKDHGTATASPRHQCAQEVGAAPHPLILPKTQGLLFSNPHSSALPGRSGLSSNEQLTSQAPSSFSNQTKPPSPSTPALPASQARP